MTTDDSSADSCASKAAKPSASASIPNRKSSSYQYRYKLDVYSEVLRRLKDLGVPGSDSADFDDDLWAHFNRLPARYVMDVNVERAEDVLSHKKLLELAKDPANRPAISVRLVQVHPLYDENQDDSVSSSQCGDHSHCSSIYINKTSVHPPPAFGSSSNLESLAIEAANQQSWDGDSAEEASQNLSRPMHEITCSTDDKPKLLSQLTSLLAEMGLNIQEAHAFSTNDGYSLDVFVVDGWPHEETEQLREVLLQELLKIENQEMVKRPTWSPKMEIEETSSVAVPVNVQISTDVTDVWEIDFRLLKLETKVTSGSFGDLYRGSYRSQEVAVKVIKPERVDADMQREFAQEVYILRKIRHKNVVQFIGACTKPPTLCIVTEFMSGGSVYDFLHNRKGVFKLPSLLRAAIDISEGMNYLHQNNIIHRDLKAANLLMDENEVIKVADFGVARVKSPTGIMTAETGTYRWMAPEVIEHKAYDHKADVFSFGIVLWELLTGKIPYEYLTPLQAAVGVAQSDLRPIIPALGHPKLKELIEKCWQKDPAQRPEFSEILEILQPLAKEVGEGQNAHSKGKSIGGFFSALRRG